MTRTFATAFALLTAFAAPALAQTAQDSPARPVLRAEALVTGAIVKVGDLVDNAGIIANVAIVVLCGGTLMLLARGRLFPQPAGSSSPSPSAA